MSSLAAAGADNYAYALDAAGKPRKAKGKGAAGRGGHGQPQTVRFEMPFDARCGACGASCGRGTRFNARKEKAGSYLSAVAVWRFTMRASCCASPFVIETDPARAGFRCVSGCVARAAPQTAALRPDEGDYLAGRDDASEEARRRRREDGAMGVAERAAAEEHAAERAAARMRELASASAVYRDDYAANAALRRGVREQRRERKRLQAEADSRGVGVPLLPRARGDALAAAAVDFGAGGAGAAAKRRRRAALSAPILPSRAGAGAHAQRAGAGAGSGAKSSAKVVARATLMEAIRKAHARRGGGSRR